MRHRSVDTIEHLSLCKDQSTVCVTSVPEHLVCLAKQVFIVGVFAIDAGDCYRYIIIISSTLWYNRLAKWRVLLLQVVTI